LKETYKSLIDKIGEKLVLFIFSKTKEGYSSLANKSLRPSPSKLKPKTVKKRAMPGKVTIHQVLGR